MKIRTRIILLLSTTFAVLILVFSTFVYVLSSNYVFNDFYDHLKTRTNTTISIQLEKGDGQSVKAFKEEYLERLPAERSVIVKLNEQNHIETPSKFNEKEIHFIHLVIRNKWYQTRSGNLLSYGRFYKAHDGNNYVVYTSARNMYFTKYKNYLGGLLALMFLASIVLIVVISLWLSKRLVKPVRDLRSGIHRIGTENLHIRIANKQEGDELGELINTVNNMLDRLETSFETQNNFISNASHELNTPLTGIIGQADLMLSKERSNEEYRKALSNILEQAEKLNKKTKALLVLAQTGFDGKKINFENLRVDELIFETLQTVNRIIPNHKIRFDYECLPEEQEKLELKGSAQLLQLALSNVLINACKYSENKEVDIYLTFPANGIGIHVKDQGIGIPTSEIGYIYDPFFRASNTSAFEGYGIGLPLTRNILRLHKGKITVQSEENNGTLVSFFIPYLKN